MNKKPIIAVTPTPVDITPKFPIGKKVMSVGSTDFHQTMLSKCGGIPIITNGVTSQEEADAVLSVCDGLFVTGGDDVNPALYGEEVLECCGEINHDRDVSDVYLIKRALSQNKPIIAVCRGSQITNVVLGGTLYQDIFVQAGATENHRALTAETLPGEGETAPHKRKVLPDTPLAKLIGEGEIGINSTHHQAVKTLGENCVLQAVAPDGIVESWYLDSDTQYVRCYQWHPEFQKDNDVADALFKDFIAACSK